MLLWLCNDIGGDADDGDQGILLAGDKKKIKEMMVTRALCWQEGAGRGGEAIPAFGQQPGQKIVKKT